MEMTWTDVDGDDLMEPPLTIKDFIKAVRSVKPAVSQEDIKKSEDWTRDFGSDA